MGDSRDRKRELVYLYTGVDDVEGALALYRDALGGELVWRFRAMGTEVAAVRIGIGPLILLAEHRDAPSILPIWSVPDLDQAVTELGAAGFTGPSHTVEVPDGPCVVLTDVSGNEIALLHRVRPDAMPHSYADPDNPGAARD